MTDDKTPTAWLPAELLLTKFPSRDGAHLNPALTLILDEETKGGDK